MSKTTIKSFSPVLFCFCVLSASPSVRAEDCLSFGGEYRYVGGQRQRDARAAMIEDVVSAMNVLIRPLARSKLSEVTEIPPRVTFETRGDQIAIVLPPRPPRYSRLDGSRTPFRNTRGSRAVVSRRIRGNVIVEDIAIGRKRRVITYRFSNGGRRLSLRWTVEAPSLLPAPVGFNLTYRLVGEPTSVVCRPGSSSPDNHSW